MEDESILVTCMLPRLSSSDAAAVMLCYCKLRQIMYLTQYAPINHLGWNAIPWRNFARVSGTAVSAAREEARSSVEIGIRARNLHPIQLETEK